MTEDQQATVAPPTLAPVLDGVRVLHPLDPLTAEEIRSATGTGREAHPGAIRSPGGAIASRPLFGPAASDYRHGR